MELVIVGGGVVGLACAMVAAQKGIETILIERHNKYGVETSSRNSEVIHSGIYYPENTLKAKLCVEANKNLYHWCEKYQIPHRRIGKYIIATEDSELPELYRLFEQAKLNGVSGIELVNKSRIKQEEPNIKAIAALWSPNTGIIDSHSLMNCYYQIASENGAMFAFNHKVIGINRQKDRYLLKIQDTEGNLFDLDCNYVINSAGLDADTIAALAGIDVVEAGYYLYYCKGSYFRLNPSKKGLVNHLIYPIPPANMTSLGIHITLDLQGYIKFGPDVEYLNNRNQDYRVDENAKDKFYHSVSRYLNNIEPEDLMPDQSGIRAKLQGPGMPYRDFIIKEESERNLPGFINLIGIDSPGLTCSLEIAKIAVNYIN